MKSERNQVVHHGLHHDHKDIFSHINGPLVFAGECMLELVNKSDTQLAKSFAGDLYNSSVYLKRAFPQLNVEFMSCIGQDILSIELLQRMQTENVGHQFIPQLATHHLGCYMVVTDKFGERSFIYWRNDSAAKRMITALSATQSDALDKAGVFFFSGITIAVLLEQERGLFWQKIEQMKHAGVLIIFDPNYRPQLWQSVALAKINIERAFQLADVLLPGVDDFQKLYGLQDVEQCIDFCQQFAPRELVIKQGEKNVHIIHAQGRVTVPVVASQHVVDTTSAGDAFNGVYIGARLSNFSPTSAALAANAAASKVIETPGAIMPKTLFDAFWKTYPLQR
jgi:2-dehydro-3-deoxygluconokinase